MQTKAKMAAEQESVLETRVRERFGVLPNFFRLGPETPEITEMLWGFAQAAYLDNPLPSVFKERLFVRLSRFCEIRYCIARHTGFLLGLGRPAGDSGAPLHTVEEVVQLLQRPLPQGTVLANLLSDIVNLTEPLDDLPARGSDMERALFSLASHVFLQTSDARACLEALRSLLGVRRLQYLLLLLAFVRTAHYWTKIHPGLAFESDLEKLLATHEALSECILRDPEAHLSDVSVKIVDELAVLRQQAEQAQRLHELSERLIHLQDQERRQIARELHDSMGQLLSLLSMNLSQLTRRVPQKPDTTQSMEICMSLASEATRQLRTISYLLHPPLLDELGLPSALKEFVGGFQERSGISIDIQISDDFGRLSQGMEIALFRVIQEALTNIHKHSGSQRASIRLSRNAGLITLEIEDDGHGIPPEKLAELQGGRTAGVGMAGIRERLRPYGGTLSIQSDGRGTTLTILNHCR